MTVSLTTLDNGLRVVTDAMPHLDSLAVGVWVDAGARHEHESEHGLAHMLEHMAFKGTASRSARDIAEAVEAVGGSINAYTGRSQTAYYMRLLKDDLALGLDILSEILRTPRFDEAELERERGVILQEIGRALDTPEDSVFDYAQEAAYPGQTLGRTILGTADSVSRLDESALRGYMARHYHPNHMVVGAGGAVDHDALVALAGKAFGDLPPSPERAPVAPAHFEGGPRLIDKPHEQLHMVLTFEGVSIPDPDYYTSWAYAEILGGGMSSRLFQQVREAEGLAYSVYAFTRSYADTGKLVLYAGTGAGQGGAVLDIALGEMAALTRSVGEDELARAKAQIRAGVLMGRESPMARAETAVIDLLTENRLIDVSEIIGRVDAIGVDDVKRFAARLLDGAAPVLAAVGPLADFPEYDSVFRRLGR